MEEPVNRSRDGTVTQRKGSVIMNRGVIMTRKTIIGRGGSGMGPGGYTGSTTIDGFVGDGPDI
jgi:hypothetical protein